MPPSEFPGGFTFNEFLIDDEEPLLYHTGLRGMFPLVRDAVASVLPLDRLRHIGFSHYEADECGSLNELLAAAPHAAPLCGELAALTSVQDVADRPPRMLQDGETLSLGAHTVQWLATPHLPHAWECGHLFETSTATLFCGDLLSQAGHEHEPLVEHDILGASESTRAEFDYYANTPQTGALFEKLAQTEPRVLACMHGSSWRGDGAGLLRELAARVVG